MINYTEASRTYVPCEDIEFEAGYVVIACQVYSCLQCHQFHSSRYPVNFFYVDAKLPPWHNLPINWMYMKLNEIILK